VGRPDEHVEPDDDDGDVDLLETIRNSLRVALP
jgi:hypothetical protein